MLVRAQGIYQDGIVTVAEPGPANRLYNKGFFGTPQTGNSLHLDAVEAIHCIQTDRLVVDGLSATDLLLAAPAGTEVQLHVYQDLRDRGLVVRPRGDLLDAWARGEGPPKAPWFTTRAHAERAPIDVADLTGEASVASVVDEDGQVTHYEAGALAPFGDVTETKLPAVQGRLMGDRVLIEDPPAELAEQFLGTTTPNGRMLSLVEAAYLADSGALAIAGLHEAARNTQPQFDAVLPVHRALRAAGVVTRSGFRFGTHLRCYSGDPDKGHAEWLIQCILPDEPLAWSTLSRGVRLAHGVRKTFALATATDPVTYTQLTWFRP